MDRHGLSALAMTRVDVAGMRVGYYEPVDRHGLRPRDDKVGVGAWLLSLRGASVANDAAIHWVSGDADGGCGSFIESQWIATGFALGMTRWGKTAF